MVIRLSTVKVQYPTQYTVVVPGRPKYDGKPYNHTSTNIEKKRKHQEGKAKKINTYIPVYKYIPVIKSMFGSGSKLLIRIKTGQFNSNTDDSGSATLTCILRFFM